MLCDERSEGWPTRSITSSVKRSFYVEGGRGTKLPERSESRPNRSITQGITSSVERSFYTFVHERNEARWNAQYHSDTQIVSELKTACGHVVVQRKRRPSSADDAIITAAL
jgi:hypothetical protein